MKHTKSGTKSLLVCFTGMDGSGKSTVAKMLVEVLEERGIHSTYLWCGWRKFESPLLGPVAWFVKKLRRRSKKDSASGLDMNTQSVRNPLHRKLIVLDYLLSTVIKIKIPLMRGRNIICDRYVYDLQADLLRQHKTTGRILRRLLPKPDMVFLIDLPEEVAFKRKNDVPSIDYLTQRRGGFLDLAKQYNMIVLDGSKPLKELRSQITVETEPLIKGGGDD